MSDRSTMVESGQAFADGEERREVEHLRRALVTRAVIGQAMGILMERYKITADEAFDELKAASQAANVRLAELAHDLADTGEWPPPTLGEVQWRSS